MFIQFQTEITGIVGKEEIELKVLILLLKY